MESRRAEPRALPSNEKEILADQAERAKMELLSAYQRRNLEIETRLRTVEEDARIRLAENEAKCLFLEASKRTAEKQAEESIMRAREAETLYRSTLLAAERLCKQDEEESLDEPAWARRVWCERRGLKSKEEELNKREKVIEQKEVAIHRKATAEARRFAERAAYDAARDEALQEAFQKSGIHALERAALAVQDLLCDQDKTQLLDRLLEYSQHDDEQNVQLNAKTALAQRRLAEVEARCLACRESKKRLHREITNAEHTLRLLAVRIDDMAHREQKTNAAARKILSMRTEAESQFEELCRKKEVSLDLEAASLAVNGALAQETERAIARCDKATTALKAVEISKSQAAAEVAGLEARAEELRHIDTKLEASMSRHAAAQRILDNFEDAGKAAAVTLDAISSQIDIKRLKALQAETRTQRKLADLRGLTNRLEEKQQCLLAMERTTIAFDTAAHARCLASLATARADTAVTVLLARRTHFDDTSNMQNDHQKKIIELNDHFDQSQQSLAQSQRCTLANSEALRKVKLDLDRAHATAAAAEAKLHLRDHEDRQDSAISNQRTLDANAAAHAAREAMSLLASKELERERERQAILLTQEQSDAKAALEAVLSAHQEAAHSAQRSLVQSHLESITTQAHASIAQTSQRKDELRLECDQIQAASIAAKDRLHKIQASCDVARGEYQELEASKLKLKAELNDTKSKIVTANTEYRELQDAKVSANHEMRNIEATVTAKRSEFDQSEAARVAAKARLAEIEAAVSAARSEYTQLEAASGDAKSILFQIETKRNDVRRDYDEVEAKAIAIRLECDQLEASNVAARAQLAETVMEVEALRTECHMLEATKVEKATQLSEIEIRASTLRHESITLENKKLELSEIEAQSSASRSSLTALQSEIARTRSDLTVLRAQHDTMKMEVAALETWCKEEREEVASAETTRVQIKEDIAKLETAQKEHQAVMVTSRNELATLHTKIEDVRLELANTVSLKSEAKDELSKLEENIKSVNSALAIVKMTSEEEIHKAERIKIATADSQKEIDQLTAKLQALHLRYESERSELTRVETARDVARRELEYIDATRKQAEDDVRSKDHALTAARKENAEMQALQEERAKELALLRASLEGRARALETKTEEVKLELVRLEREAQLARQAAASDRALRVAAAAWAEASRDWAENALEPRLRVLEARALAAEEKEELIRMTSEKVLSEVQIAKTEAQRSVESAQAEVEKRLERIRLEETELQARKFDFAEQIKKAQATLRRQKMKAQNDQLARAIVSVSQEPISNPRQEQQHYITPQSRRRRRLRRQPLRNHNTPYEMKSSDEDSSETGVPSSIHADKKAETHFRVSAMARGLETLLLFASHAQKRAVIRKVGDRRRLRRVLAAWANYTLARPHLDQYFAPPTIDSASWGVLALLNDDTTSYDSDQHLIHRRDARAKAEEANYRARLLRGSILLPPADL